MDRVVRLFLLTLWFAGCATGYDPEPPGDLLPSSPNLTIQALHDLYRNEPLSIREPLVIQGVVTSSDQAGNFYRTLLIEQEGYALEILAGVDHLHSRYPIGSRLALRLEGLTLDKSRGLLQAGRKAPDYAYEEVTYLESPVLLDQHLFRLGMEATPEASIRTIPTLRPEACGTLVEVANLHYAPLEEEEAVWSGYRRFEDPHGNVLHAYTSDYARFFGQTIPTQEISLRGILQHLESGPHSGFLIKMRDEDDMILHNE